MTMSCVLYCFQNVARNWRIRDFCSALVLNDGRRDFGTISENYIFDGLLRVENHSTMGLAILTQCTSVREREIAFL